MPILSTLSERLPTVRGTTAELAGDLRRWAEMEEIKMIIDIILITLLSFNIYKDIYLKKWGGGSMVETLNSLPAAIKITLIIVFIVKLAEDLYSRWVSCCFSRVARLLAVLRRWKYVRLLSLVYHSHHYHANRLVLLVIVGMTGVISWRQADWPIWRSFTLVVIAGVILQYF